MEPAIRKVCNWDGAILSPDVEFFNNSSSKSGDYLKYHPVPLFLVEIRIQTCILPHNTV